MSSKGLKLSGNKIVLIGIVVLAIVAALSLVFGNFYSGSTTDQSAFTTGCNNLVTRYNCEAGNVNKVEIQGYGNCTLGYACRQAGIVDVGRCAAACGCGDTPNREPTTSSCGTGP